MLLHFSAGTVLKKNTVSFFICHFGVIQGFVFRCSFNQKEPRRVPSAVTACSPWNREYLCVSNMHRVSPVSKWEDSIGITWNLTVGGTGLSKFPELPMELPNFRVSERCTLLFLPGVLTAV